MHTDGVVDAGVGDNTKFEAELLGGGGSMAISDFARTVWVAYALLPASIHSI
ncbi:MAG: hypothetical protein IPL35_12465 [Sphingobacteriales bacterium]|nr:hypothetical protein [Sphingobacteriales bacterium]